MRIPQAGTSVPSSLVYVAPPGGYDRVRQFVDNSTMAQGYKDLIYSYYNYLVDRV